jgi:2'-5' RNA ligase
VAAVEAAGEAAECTRPFALSLAGLGAFPSLRKPRVIWVGLGRDEGYRDLQQLFKQVEGELGARGFSPEDRPFAPHITLARTRDAISEPVRRDLGTTLASVAERTEITGSFRVDSVTVMRSDLSQSGPKYTPIARCRFAAVPWSDGLGRPGESA